MSQSTCYQDASPGDASPGDASHPDPSHPDLPHQPRPLHVAIVMDGNGRWAERRGLPRSAGHRAGSLAVRRTVKAAVAQGVGVPIRTLTLYAFSSDNWGRPAAEVGALMRLFLHHLRTEAARCERQGVRVSVIGRRDRLGSDLRAAIESIEARTLQGRALHLQIAIDYSARGAILEAVGLHGGLEGPSREDFAALMARALHAPAPVPDVDLLVRTGGELRLSDFMLWECAYAELVFTPCLWPDFGSEALAHALEEFRGRTRRFGCLPPCGPLPTPTGPTQAEHARIAEGRREVGTHV